MFTSELLDLGIKETRAVIAAIRSGHGDDFSDFNLGVLGRRFALAIKKFNIRQLEALEQRLIASDRDFYMDFLAELTPPTTELFRDPSFWVSLRDNILPQLLTHFGNLNILQAAYDTGEELYSLLILLHEAKIRDRVQITTVYLSTNTLSELKAGLLPLRRRELDEANLNRFGALQPYSYYIAEEGNEAPHFREEFLENIEYIRLAPEYSIPATTRYHLILCRNQFLYFNPSLGVRNMNAIVASLFSSGVLVLGTKEFLGSYQNDSTFTVLNREESIYRKKVL